MTLQEQMIKAMDEADKYSNKPFLREHAAKVCAEIAEQYARSKWDEACEGQISSCIRYMKVENSALQYSPKPEFKP